ncbi:MAG: efflux RND transporter periplasmic adaptor subunit [Opitutaceae bacterium]|nr:efflux RND transporter periplasmic adaptor subunit [Opitutaceae bacterium]
MKLKLPLTILAVLVLGGAGVYFISKRASHTAAGSAESGHGAAAAEEAPKGPHGGKLFRDGDFAAELAIYEKGVPPEFRAWFTQGGKPLAPATVKFNLQLTRPGNVVDHYTFTQEGDYLRGSSEVYEPHSFTYLITAEHGGRSHRWELAAPEMQTTINAESAKTAGVVAEPAGPATLAETVAVYGQVKLNGNKVSRVIPRFPGVVREARKALGDAVTAGEVVAVIESNQTLTTFEVKAPIAGIIVERGTTAGEAVAEGAPLYTIADLADVWIDLNIQKRDQARVRVGQAVALHADDGGKEATGKLAWISPLGSVESQTLSARVVMPNSDGRWRPGLFVKAAITVEEIPVPVAVKESGLQTLFSFTVVFSQHGDLYQARPVEIGRRSGGYVEVLKGLKAGELYVTENSFLIKADIGKSGATHDH